MSVVVLDAPPYLQAITRLDANSQRVVLTLLDHPITKRLQKIQALGYTTKAFTSATHTRWDHTLWTIDAMCNLLEASPKIPLEIKTHLLALVVIQDIGHSALSNSLAESFIAESGDQLLQILPSDKAWTVRIIQSLEKHERLFSQLGLHVDVIIQLLVGRIPWSKYSWLKRLIEGVLDADRLAYVEQDSGLTLSLPTGRSVQRIAKSLIHDGPSDSTVIDSGGAESTLEFIKVRGHLYIDVYNNPTKLAWEFLMRDFLRYLWEHNSTLDDNKYEKPLTVEDFLLWTDQRVHEAITELALTDTTLAEAVRLLKNGELMVAEVTEPQSDSMSFNEIDILLEQLAIETFPKRPMWVIQSDQLEIPSLYEPNSILVKDRDGYKPFERIQPSVAPLVRRLRRRPMLILPYSSLQAVLKQLVSVGLTLDQLLPITER